MWHWLDVLFPPRSDEVLLRDVPLDAFLARLSPRVVEKTSPYTIALLPFGDPVVRAAIHEAKYRGSEHAFTLLAAALCDYLRDSDIGFTTPRILVVPVPLGAARRKERGFNQTEEVAKRAQTKYLFTLDPSVLARIRDTESQVSLSRAEREANMRGAFRAKPALDPSPTYLILDDVVTTGATLQAAIDALTAAGASHIIPLALAH